MNIIGQEQVKAFLESRIQKLPQALLFCGPDGSGKASAAREVAKELGYQIKEYSPDNEAYKVKEVRDILKSYRDLSNLVILINNADLLQGPAASLLLKSLEDTKNGVIFILTAREANQVLYTIYSRCVTLEFSLIQQEDIKKYLSDKYNIWNDTYVRIANGSFKTADEVASGHHIEKRNLVWSFLSEIKFLNEDSLNIPDFLKEETDSFIGIGINLLYDIIKISSNEYDTVVNADLIDEYNGWLDRYSVDFAIFCMICFRDILRNIRNFYNVDLHLKTLVLKLKLGSVPI